MTGSAGSRMNFHGGVAIFYRMGAMKLADLRQEYMRAGLAETAVHADPLVQFERWFHDAQAAGLPLANAMTLATVAESGAPSASVWLFLLNYNKPNLF